MPKTLSFDDECQRTVDVLDRVMADRARGRPSQSSHDGHVDQVTEAATRLLSAARGPGRSINPPLARVGDGCLW